MFHTSDINGVMVGLQTFKTQDDTNEIIYFLERGAQWSFITRQDLVPNAKTIKIKTYTNFSNFTGKKFVFDKITSLIAALTDSDSVTKTLSHQFYIHDENTVGASLFGLGFFRKADIILNANLSDYDIPSTSTTQIPIESKNCITSDTELQSYN